MDKTSAKRFRIGLLPAVLAAIALGMACSLFFPVWAVRVFATFNSIFSNFLGMFIPLLIIGLVAPAITDLGKEAGRLLAITIALAYISTVLAGLTAYFTGMACYPRMLGDYVGLLGDMDMGEGIAPYFTIEMPAFINVTTALILAFILGLGGSASRGDTLRKLMGDFREIIMLTIRKVVIPCLPLFIFGLFLKIGAEGKIAPVLGMFVKIIVLIIILHVGVLVAQFLIAGAIAGKNPLRSLVTMLPAYVTALGTQSSAATIPVTLSCAKKLGIRADVADFTVPLCATIHMPCSILKITACSLAVSYCCQMPVDAGSYIGFVMMLAVTMIAAPGVPGGAVMAAVGVMESMLGFDASMQGIVIAIYIALDGFGTAGNVTGDGAIALIVNRIRGDKRG